jgi:hypothetical protein
MTPFGENRGGTPTGGLPPQQGAEPHRKVRRLLNSVCRRSASFICFFSVFAWLADTDRDRPAATAGYSSKSGSQARSFVTTKSGERANLLVSVAKAQLGRKKAHRENGEAWPCRTVTFSSLNRSC